MQKFFRKIRYDFMEKKKIGGYFKYAVGEIILVVIGILIALSINNMNEGRKNAMNEAYLLNEILNNLKEDSLQIQFILERRNATQTAVENLLEILKAKKIEEKNLEENIAQFLTFERFYPLNNAFEMMKSSALVVKNKPLRTAISRYYDFEQKKAVQSIKDIESVYLRLVHTENAIRSNLESSKSGTKESASIKLINPSDPKFLELLNTELIGFKDNNSTSIVRISDFYDLNVQLTSLIKKELDNSRLKRHLD